MWELLRPDQARILTRNRSFAYPHHFRILMPSVVPLIQTRNDEDVGKGDLVVLGWGRMSEGAPGGFRVKTECYLQHPKAVSVLATVRLIMPPPARGQSLLLSARKPLSSE